MHRIDSSTATPDGRFTEGNPTIPVPATTVTADWLNAMQEEAIAVLAAAGIAPDKANNAQMLAAILKLIADETPLAKVGTPGLVMPDGTTIVIDSTGKISTKAQSMDPVGGIRFFEDEMPRAGYVECNAGVVSNFSTTYPQMVAYLETPYGQSRLVTLAEYESLHVAVWHTNADGSKVGFNGIGGVAKFVWDKAADTLKMPDLQEMFRGARGPSLGVGGVHGDSIYRHVHNQTWTSDQPSAFRTSRFYVGPVSSISGAMGAYMDITADSGAGAASESTESVLTTDYAGGSKTAPRAWGALACAYLGTPVIGS